MSELTTILYDQYENEIQNIAEILDNANLSRNSKEDRIRKRAVKQLESAHMLMVRLRRVIELDSDGDGDGRHIIQSVLGKNQCMKRGEPV